MILTNIFDNKNPNNMKPIEKPQFFALCETLRSMNTYRDALESLQSGSEYLAKELKKVISEHGHDSVRWCPDELLEAISDIEMNVTYIKHYYIHDIIEEYEAQQEKILTKLCKKYHITED